MIIKIQGRQTGKTTDIIQHLKDDNKAIMIVFSPTHKKDIINEHKLFKRVFTIYEVMENKVLRGLKYSVAYIDEVGACLNTLIPRIKYGTHTNEEK